MSVEFEDNGIPVDTSLGKASSEQRVLKNIMRIAGDHKTHLPLDIGSLLHPSADRTGRRTSLDYESVMSQVQEVTSVLADSGVMVPDSTGNDAMLSDANFTLGEIARDAFNPGSLIDNSSYHEWSAAEIGAVTIVILMVPFILCSNLMVILSVVRYRRLHTPTNYFVTSLAAVDVLVALAVPFVVVIEVFHFGGADGPRDVVLCLLPNRVLMMACGVSVLTLATIAYDRHTALVSPLEYVNIMTSRKVAAMVAVTWIYSAIIVWLPLMIGWFSDPSEVAPCSSNLLNGKASVLFLGAIFVPSCIAILVCYSRIFLVARHHAKAIAAVEFAIHRNLQVKFMIKDTKYAKTLALVIGFFLTLWLPYLIYIFIQTICPIRFDIWIQTYLILLAVLNSGINPWIYAFKNNEFRAAFKRMFKELCRDRMCPAVDRRASLVPTVSTTPRLSRTDSRMLSNLLESTLDILNEHLKCSVNSLVDSDGKLYDAACVKSNTNVPDDEALVSPVSSPKQLVRHTASCCDLDSYTESAPTKGEPHHKFSRSYSLDFGLTHNSLADVASQACSIGENTQADNVNSIDNVNICAATSTPGHISNVEYSDKTVPSLVLVDESSSNVNISVSSHRSSNMLPSSSSLAPSSSGLTLQAATLSMTSMGAYTSPFYPQHHHSPPASCHPTHAPCYGENPTIFSPALSYIHSFSYADEQTTELGGAHLHGPQQEGGPLTPTTEAHPILAHTHSCPTLDPFDQSRAFPYWDRNVFCSYLGPHAGAADNNNNGHNYVSRLGSADRYTNTKFFI